MGGQMDRREQKIQPTVLSGSLEVDSKENKNQGNNILKPNKYQPRSNIWKLNKFLFNS